jgi:hypothetical protein
MHKISDLQIAKLQGLGFEWVVGKVRGLDKLYPPVRSGLPTTVWRCGDVCPSLSVSMYVYAETAVVLLSEVAWYVACGGDRGYAFAAIALLTATRAL